MRGIFEKVKGSGVWWVHYYENGHRHRERVGRKSLAIARYQQRKTEIREGRFFPHSGVGVADLAQAYLDDYRVNGKDVDFAGRCWKHLSERFGAMRAHGVTTEHITAYILARSKAGAANATINRELAALKRMFNLAARSSPPRIARAPVFPSRLKESPPRAGFVEDSQFLEILKNAVDAWLKAALTVAYKFGFRKRELLSLRVGQVDLARGTIRLNPGTTKNQEGRIAPMTAEVKRLLEFCVRGKSAQDFVFTRSGRPVLDFRKAWQGLTIAAGVPGLLVHDLRRSAVRNMIRRGIPERVAMAISGHKSRSVFDRYNIVSETDILEAGRKLEDITVRRTAQVSHPRACRAASGCSTSPRGAAARHARQRGAAADVEELTEVPL